MGVLQNRFSLYSVVMFRSYVLLGFFEKLRLWRILRRAGDLEVVRTHYGVKVKRRTIWFRKRLAEKRCRLRRSDWGALSEAWQRYSLKAVVI